MKKLLLITVTFIALYQPLWLRAENYICTGKVYGVPHTISIDIKKSKIQKFIYSSVSTHTTNAICVVDASRGDGESIWINQNKNVTLIKIPMNESTSTINVEIIKIGNKVNLKLVNWNYESNNYSCGMSGNLYEDVKFELKTKGCTVTK